MFGTENQNYIHHLAQVQNFATVTTINSRCINIILEAVSYLRQAARPGKMAFNPIFGVLGPLLVISNSIGTFPCIVLEGTILLIVNKYRLDPTTFCNTYQIVTRSLILDRSRIKIPIHNTITNTTRTLTTSFSPT